MLTLPLRADALIQVTNVDVEPSSSPSLAARRAHKRRVNRDQPLCPSGLTACPLPGAVLTDPQNSASLRMLLKKSVKVNSLTIIAYAESAGYECLDIATDMVSHVPISKSRQLTIPRILVAVVPRPGRGWTARLFRMRGRHGVTSDSVLSVNILRRQ